MNAVKTFLAMGGYAPYVWSAVGVTIGAGVAQWWITWHRQKCTRQKLHRWYYAKHNKTV